MGMKVEHFKHEGTLCSSDLLKIFVKMGVSWSAQDFRQTGVTQSGPGAFFSFSASGRPGTPHLRCSELQVWGRGGLLEVLLVVWRGVQSGCGVFFQTCSRTHSDRLPVVDSPQCWGMMSCSWLSLSDLFYTDAESLEENWILSLSE